MRRSGVLLMGTLATDAVEGGIEKPFVLVSTDQMMVRESSVDNLCVDVMTIYYLIFDKARLHFACVVASDCFLWQISVCL